MATSSAPDTFREFEHAGWQRAAPVYEKEFSRLTSETGRPLLDAVGVGRGVRVLDVATGPGHIAEAAAQREARVIGLDFSSAMVAEARRRYPAIDFREGDAEALPFADESFDAVTMNFGLLHMGQPERAVREAWRVLVPGGRFGFTVWASPDQAVGLGIVLRAVQSYGNPNVPLPPGPPFFRYSDPAECERTLYGAGFKMPQVVQLPLVWRLDSPDALFESLLQGTVRMASLLRAQAHDALGAIRAAIAEGTRLYQRGSQFEVPMSAVLAWASRSEPS
jgi:ubiquinone/menaquinone biosynthesis C-methylase UbiE